MYREYPYLTLHRDKLLHNAREVVSRCRASGIEVCGVIKGCNGMAEAAQTLLRAGATSLGTSRLEQVEACRRSGITAPFLLVRIPALCELADTVALCEMSLQSEWDTMAALERECARRQKTHRVIVMADLGDLREGFCDYDEMVEVCARVEETLPHVELAGVGVNLGCYGSVKPTVEKMEELLALARRVEVRIGRKLDIVSGGATSSYPLVHGGVMPGGINHLRLGESILVAKDLQVDWGIRDMDYLHMDVFTLTAQIIEVRDKPSCPWGELCIDAFGHRPVYTDIGVRRRALLALGRADVGEVESLRPVDAGVSVVGGSSDHCIVDVTDCARPLRVGDEMTFTLCYSHMLYATSRSDMRVVLAQD